MPLPFDLTHYSAEELAYGRLVVQLIYHPGTDRHPPDAPFDPTLYRTSELELIRRTILALRHGVTTPGTVRAQQRLGKFGSEARLVKTLDVGESDQASAVPLTDWFACPHPVSSSLLSSSGNDAHPGEVPTSSETQLPGSEEPIHPVMCLCYGIRRSNRDGKLVTEVVRPNFFDGKQISQEDHPTFFSRKPFALRPGCDAPEDRDSP